MKFISFFPSIYIFHDKLLSTNESSQKVGAIIFGSQKFEKHDIASTRIFKVGTCLCIHSLLSIVNLFILTVISLVEILSLFPHQFIFFMIRCYIMINAVKFLSYHHFWISKKLGRILIQLVRLSIWIGTSLCTHC